MPDENSTYFAPEKRGAELVWAVLWKNKSKNEKSGTVTVLQTNLAFQISNQYVSSYKIVSAILIDSNQKMSRFG